MSTTKAAGRLVDPGQVYPPGGEQIPYRILDVRAPVEYARGSLPGSLNLPILEDDERHQVGIRYKEAGQEAAIELGFELTREVMPQRVASWRRASEGGQSAILCWRGGMRSRLAQSFLDLPDVPRVRGGYKAMRAQLLGGMRRILAEGPYVVVIGGMTGSGKTELLSRLEEPHLLPIDLEAIARHRGSSFGEMGDQPSQQTFENELAARVVLFAGRRLVVEDESRHVGSVHLPNELFESMATGPMLVLDAPRRERIARIHRDYIVEPLLRLGPGETFERLRLATERLRRRLGGTLVDELVSVLRRVRADESWQQADALEPFIGPLLDQYYDPLYRRSMARSTRRIVARGNEEELLSWLRTNA